MRRWLRWLRRQIIPPRAAPLILMYHRIAETESDPWGLAVSPAHFEEQLRVLRDEWTVMPLNEFGRLHRLGRLPPRSVAITFDDGYACNAQIAAPLLHAYRVPATMFLTTGMIGSMEEFWWDELERLLFQNSESMRIVLGTDNAEIEPDRDSPDQRRTWRAMVEPQTSRQRLYCSLWQRLRDLPNAERNAFMSSLRNQMGANRMARDSHRTMTLAEAARMASLPEIEIGAHTVSHPALAKHSAEAQQSEVEKSRDACLSISGAKPMSFAYPFGVYDETTRRIVQEAGFQQACSTRAAPVHPGTDSFCLPRFQVRDVSADAFSKILHQAARQFASS